jgi:ubiquitin-conjugating enzyme (huntingtin interacting protein 2)
MLTRLFASSDILKDAWSPVLTLKSTLISLQSLLCDPQPDDPQDAEGTLRDAIKFTALPLTLLILSIVAKHYKTSRDSFNKTAKYWAQAYAGAPLDGSSAAPAPPTSVDDDDEIVVTGQRSRAVELAGLEQSSVNKFKAMGFAEDQIVCAILLVPSSLIYLT